MLAALRSDRFPVAQEVGLLAGWLDPSTPLGAWIHRVRDALVYNQEHYLSWPAEPTAASCSDAGRALPRPAHVQLGPRAIPWWWESRACRVLPVHRLDQTLKGLDPSTIRDPARNLRVIEFRSAGLCRGAGSGTDLRAAEGDPVLLAAGGLLVWRHPALDRASGGAFSVRRLAPARCRWHKKPART